MKRIPIGEASYDQLLAYCQTVLGLEVNRGTPTGKLMAKIESVQPGTTEIVVAEEAPPAPAAQPAAQASAPAEMHGAREAAPEPVRKEATSLDHRGDRMVTIQIPNQPGPGGEREVVVSVEGTVFQIKREQQVPVPMRVYLALKNAVEKHYKHVPSKVPGERPDVEETEIQSYPFMAFNPPSAEELEAYNRAGEIDPEITLRLKEERERKLALSV